MKEKLTGRASAIAWVITYALAFGLALPLVLAFSDFSSGQAVVFVLFALVIATIFNVIFYSVRKLYSLRKRKEASESKKNKKDLALRLIGELKALGQQLRVMERTIRKQPTLFKCANDFVIMNHFRNEVQSAAIGVGCAISFAHTLKIGAPKPPPIPDPLPEFDSCPHCHGSYSFTKLIGNNCPHCGKKVREPNVFVEMLRHNPAEHQAILNDIDQTP